MPGISFACDLTGLSDHGAVAIKEALSGILHSADYEATMLAMDSSFIVAWTAYAGYPVTVLAEGELQVYLEGRIYNRDERQLRLEAQALAMDIFSRGVSVPGVKSWLRSLDGEFVVGFCDRVSRKLAFITDALGRLPLYYCKTASKLLLSREIGFISQLIDRKTCDRMALAQALLFGYPLGENTLMQDVLRVPPGSVIVIDAVSKVINQTSIGWSNLDELEGNGKTIAQNGGELARHFAHACRLRANGVKPVVLSLSGGLDSRSVGASLWQAEIPFSAVTLHMDKLYWDDVQVAEKLARLFDCPWQVLNVGKVTAASCLRLLGLKQGLNSLGMGFMLPFLQMIRDTYGSDIVFLTGDGGDKVLPDLTPKKRLIGSQDLVSYIVENNSVLSLREIEMLTGVSKQRMWEGLENLVCTYPERSWENKYVHFLLFQRGFKWLYEGEDRNRCYCWSVTPFYAGDFFQQAMGCLPGQKAGYRLYKEFLMKLSPKVAMIENVHWNSPIGGTGYKVRLAVDILKRQLPRGIRRYARRVKDGRDIDRRTYLHIIREQCRSSAPLKSYLSWPTLQGIAAKSTRKEMDVLLTATSFLESLESTQSTLEAYGDAKIV